MTDASASVCLLIATALMACVFKKRPINFFRFIHHSYISLVSGLAVSANWVFNSTDVLYNLRPSVTHYTLTQYRDNGLSREYYKCNSPYWNREGLFCSTTPLPTNCHKQAQGDAEIEASSFTFYKSAIIPVEMAMRSYIKYSSFLLSISFTSSLYTVVWVRCGSFLSFLRDDWPK